MNENWLRNPYTYGELLFMPEGKMIKVLRSGKLVFVLCPKTYQTEEHLECFAHGYGVAESQMKSAIMQAFAGDEP